MRKITLPIFGFLLFLSACATTQAACAAYEACYLDRAPAQVTSVECTPRDGGADCLWFEPGIGQAPIVDYIVKYKTGGDSAYTIFADGVSTDTAASITGLSNGIEYSVTVQARNKYGDAPASPVETVTPAGAGAIDGLDDVLTGVVAVWNANNYSGTGDWLNEAATPADGSAQSAYDLTPSGAFYTDGCFEFDGSHNFDIGTNTAFLNALGKTSAGGDWHVIALTETALASPQMTLLGTADVAADSGVVWRVDSGGAQKLDQYNGTAAVTQNGTATVTQNSRNILAAGYDRDSNLAKFALNSDTQITKTANWTTSTADATHSLKVGSEGNGGSMTSGWRLCGLALIDHDLSDSELAAANDWFDAEFPAAPPGVPDAPVSVIAMPSNGSVHLAWDLWNENGAAVTDYTIQRDCGSGYSTFSDGTSTNKFATVTGLSNGTACSFRVSATNSAGTSANSTPVSATPAAEGTNPYDETDYKLTTPVNAQGNRTGSAAEITSTIGTYQSAWFGRVGDTFVFNCVYPGATTATATYARSELRGLYNGQQFNFDDDSDDTLDFAVTDCPTSAGNTKVIVQQIHDADEPIYKLNYDCKAGTGTDTIRALVKVGDGDALDCDWNRNGIKDSGESCPTLKTLSRGTRTKSRVVYDGDGSSHGGQQTIDFYIDDVLAFTTPLYRSGANDPMYTKRGNYCQLGPAGSKTTVVHYDAGLGGGGGPPPFTPADVASVDIWMNPTDGGSITSSGGLVSQLDNQISGGTDAVQGTGSLQPTTGTRTINAANAIDFIPTDSLTIAEDLTAATEYSFGFAINPDGFTSTTRHLFDQTPGSTGAALRFAQTTGVITWFTYTNSGQITLTGPSGLSTGTTYLIAGRFKSGAIQLYVNGGTPHVTSSSTFSSITDATGDLVIGARQEGDQGFDGLIQGFWFSKDTAVSDAELNNLMNYLETQSGGTWTDI